MAFQSPFGPVPPLPEVNVHDFLFSLPGRTVTKDYTLHIDGLTGQKVSRTDFLERVRDGATALSTPVSAGGLGIGDHEDEIVGIYSHNALDYVVLVHSLLCITTPIALLSAHATAFELTHSLRTSKATRLFVQPALLKTALQAAREVGLSENCIYTLGDHVQGRKSFGELIAHVKTHRTPRVPVRSAKRDTLAYLIFSSGTTGLPKAVMVSHGNICYTLAQNDIVYRLDSRPVLDTPPVALAFLPMYHTYGLHMFCFRGFWVPLTFVVIPKWDIDLVLKLVPKYRINLLYLIPSAIHQLLHNKKLRRQDFASVMSVVSGAAHLPPKLAERLKETINKALEISQGFGMSEVTISATRMPSPGMFGGRIPSATGSVGVLLPGMEGRIVREDGTDAGANEPGELWLKGGNVAMGYWGNEAATKQTFVEGGWLRTGDRFRVDELGRLYFVDRAKDTLKVSGAQVSPTEIEEALVGHPDKLVVDACVGGVSGGRTSDEKIPRAWVVLSEEGRKRGESQVLQILDAWVRKNLSTYKWLRGGIESVHEIPKSPTGKVLRRLLQDHYEDQMRSLTSAKL